MSRRDVGPLPRLGAVQAARVQALAARDQREAAYREAVIRAWKRECFTPTP